jgi:hypothetical protein
MNSNRSGLAFHFPPLKQHCFTMEPTLDDGEEELEADATT